MTSPSTQSSGGATTMTETPTLKAALPNVGFPTLGFQIMRDQGFGKKHGVDVNYKFMSSPGASQALINGHVEIANLAPIAVVRANAQGGHYRDVYPFIQALADLVISKDAGVNSIEDLPKATIGLWPQTSLVSIMMFIILRNAGMDPSKLDVRFGALPTLFGLVKKGDLDGFVGVPPLSTLLISSGDYKSLFRFNAKWHAQTGGDLEGAELAVTEKTLSAKPKAIKRFFEAHMEANQYYLDNIDAMFTKYKDVLGYKTDQQKQMMKAQKGALPTSFRADLRNGITNVLNEAESDGYLKKPFDPTTVFVDPRKL